MSNNFITAHIKIISILTASKSSEVLLITFALYQSSVVRIVG